MRLLLDTHIALWAIGGSSRLPARARELIMTPDNIVYVSAVSIWEIAIKFAAGRRSAPTFGASQAIESFKDAGYEQLDVTAAHAAAVETLPLLHGDPFDRLLVAQAVNEPLQLVTHDRLVAAYGRMVTLV